MITAATASAIITEHTSGGADPTLQRAQDLMGQVVRQGANISLKSLQVWADLARQLAPTALGSCRRCWRLSVRSSTSSSLPSINSRKDASIPPLATESPHGKARP